MFMLRNAINIFASIVFVVMAISSFQLVRIGSLLSLDALYDRDADPS